MSTPKIWVVNYRQRCVPSVCALENLKDFPNFDFKITFGLLFRSVVKGRPFFKCKNFETGLTPDLPIWVSYWFQKRNQFRCVPSNWLITSKGSFTQTSSSLESHPSPVFFNLRLELFQTLTYLGFPNFDFKITFNLSFPSVDHQLKHEL